MVPDRFSWSREEAGSGFISRLARALLHSLRGDPSVIQNELSCLSLSCCEESIRIARMRVESITSQIGELSVLGTPARHEVVPLAQVAPGGLSSQALVRCDVRALQRALAAPARLLRSAPRSVAWAPPGTLSISFSCGAGEPAEFHSLSSFAGEMAGEREIVPAAVADLILCAHGLSARVRHEPGQVTVEVSGLAACSPDAA